MRLDSRFFLASTREPLLRVLYRVCSVLHFILPLLHCNCQGRRMAADRRCLAPGGKLEFITDVEGNLRYFDALVERSQVLQRGADGELTLREGCWFVFGGDIADRGPGDIRITKAPSLCHYCTTKVELKSMAQSRPAHPMGHSPTHQGVMLSETSLHGSSHPALWESRCGKSRPQLECWQTTVIRDEYLTVPSLCRQCTATVPHHYRCTIPVLSLHHPCSVTAPSLSYAH